MNPTLYQFLSLDAPALITALCAALTCALLGNYLVLRKESLMGDAISHSVLPGIVLGFLISGTRDPIPVFAGATIAGAASAFLIGLIQRLGKLDIGAAMSVVFSVFFALGILLIEQAADRNVDLDADCLLHGQLEHIFWTPPNTWDGFLQANTFLQLPFEVPVSLLTLLGVGLFVTVLYKELALFSFDEPFCKVSGFKPEWLHRLLMATVALAVVIAFKAVGSILVIAMLICPAATARFFTDSLYTQLWLSLLVAGVTTVLGYFLGAHAPVLLGLPGALSAAGMMTVVSGLCFIGAFFFAPRYGIMARKAENQRDTLNRNLEDLLGILYRLEEKSSSTTGTNKELVDLLGSEAAVATTITHAVSQKLVIAVSNTTPGIGLSPSGRSRAAQLVRTHRLWESYLVDQAGITPDHVHHTAHALEHFQSDNIIEKLNEKMSHLDKDPHGKTIPKVEED